MRPELYSQNTPSEIVATQIDLLRKVPIRDKDKNPLVIVGPWAERTVAFVLEERLQQSLAKYEVVLYGSKRWSVGDVVIPSELRDSRHQLSRESKVLLSLYAKTEGQLPAYEKAGDKFMISPTIKRAHRIWVAEESNHDEATNDAQQLVSGNDLPRIIDEAAQIARNRWNSDNHQGINDEAGHEIFITEQEGETAGYYLLGIRLGIRDYLAAGVDLAEHRRIHNRGYGVIGIYEAIAPEESRHGVGGRERARARFGLYPAHWLRMFGIVKRGYFMPGMSLFEEIDEIPGIAYGGSILDLRRDQRKGFSKILRSVTGLESQSTIPNVIRNLEELNNQLHVPEVRVLKPDGDLSEIYQSAA